MRRATPRRRDSRSRPMSRSSAGPADADKAVLARDQDPVDPLQVQPHAIDAGRHRLPGGVGAIPVEAMRTGLRCVLGRAVAAVEWRGGREDADQPVRRVNDPDPDGVVAGELEADPVAVAVLLDPGRADDGTL